MMDYQHFIERVPDLSDLELATFLCLVAKQHCIIETEEELIDDLASELALIVSEIFGLTYTVLSAEDSSSIHIFGDAILDKYADELEDLAKADTGNDTLSGTHSRLSAVNFRPGSMSRPSDVKLDTRKVVNVVIAKDFNLAHEDVQVQVLELIRRRRIYSRTTVHPAPEVFLFLPLMASSNRNIRLNKHLNDRIFISHYHNPEDGFTNLEEMDDAVTTELGSAASSVVRAASSRAAEDSRPDPRITISIIEKVRQLGDAATITPEVRRYLQDLVVFMRLERGVCGGVSPYATTLFVALAKYLAPLHGLTFVTPSLVALAARKIYPHRILLAPPEKERSMRYGSDLTAVRELLDGVTPETVIEAVLNTVECPL